MHHHASNWMVSREKNRIWRQGFQFALCIGRGGAQIEQVRAKKHSKNRGNIGNEDKPAT